MSWIPPPGGGVASQASAGDGTRHAGTSAVTTREALLAHAVFERLRQAPSAAGASSGAPPLDFVFGIGDDQSNEDMFAAVEALKDSDPPPEHIVSCTMGQKPSKAHFYLDSPTSVLFLLERLISEGAKMP